MNEMAALLSSCQLGYGVSKGAEAAVHTVRCYIKSLDSSRVLIKLDFKNAFNSVRRDKMLKAVQQLAPSIFPFVHSAYSSPSSLYWCDKIIQSTEGVQQGDPLGPLLFCLSLHSVCCLLRSELRVFYLDDGTLGGSLEDIAHDLELIKKEACDIGLELNTNKSEVISINESLLKSVQSILPGIREVDPAKATLRGSPIGDTTDAICAKTSFLKLLVPKLLYCLRTYPCFL
eukprot:Em0023g496a